MSVSGLSSKHVQKRVLLALRKWLALTYQFYLYGPQGCPPLQTETKQTAKQTAAAAAAAAAPLIITSDSESDSDSDSDDGSGGKGSGDELDLNESDSSCEVIERPPPPPPAAAAAMAAVKKEPGSKTKAAAPAAAAESFPRLRIIVNGKSVAPEDGAIDLDPHVSDFLSLSLRTAPPERRLEKAVPLKDSDANVCGFVFVLCCVALAVDCSASVLLFTRCYVVPLIFCFSAVQCFVFFVSLFMCLFAATGAAALSLFPEAAWQRNYLPVYTGTDSGCTTHSQRGGHVGRQLVGQRCDGRTACAVLLARALHLLCG